MTDRMSGAQPPSSCLFHGRSQAGDPCTCEPEQSKRAWTPGPWQAYDANEGTEYFPGWEVANDEYHNPSPDEDAPWIAVHLTTGVEADARLIALAPEMAEAILGFTTHRLCRCECEEDDERGVVVCASCEAIESVISVARRLRAIGGNDA